MKRPVYKKLGWKQKGYLSDYLFVMPYYSLFLLFTIFPVLAAIFYSFTDFNGLTIPHWIGIQNYFRLFLDDSLFIKALKNTLLLACVTGPLGYLLSFVVAWLINEFPPAVRTVFTLLFYTPSMCSSVFVIWQIIFSNDAYGVLNSLLLSMNLIYEPIRWTVDTNYMFGVAVVIILWMSLGTSFLAFIAGLQGVDHDLYEAAAIDGVRNRWQEAWFITLPSMKQQLMFGAVMSITGAFGVGGVITQVFGNPTTDYALHTLVHHMQDYSSVRFQLGYASAISTVLFLIMMFANTVVQRFLSRWSE